MQLQGRLPLWGRWRQWQKKRLQWKRQGSCWDLLCFVRVGVFLLFFVLFFSAREALPTWDKQIQSLCFQVNNLLEKINQTAPEWTAQAMEAQMAQWLCSLLSEWRQLMACYAGRRKLSRTVNQTNNPRSFPLRLSLWLRTQLGDTMLVVTVSQFSEHRMMLFLPLQCTLLSWKLWIPRRRSCNVRSKLWVLFI